MKITKIQQYNQSFLRKPKDARMATNTSNTQSLSSLTTKFECPITDWFSPLCFNVVYIGETRALDTTDSLNAQNLKRIGQNRQNLTSRDKLAKLYPLSHRELSYWTNYGFLKPLTLQSKDGGYDYRCGLIDLSNEANKRCLERFIPKRSQINNRMIKMDKEYIAITSDELDKLKVAPKSKVNDLVKQGILKGEYIESIDSSTLNIQDSKNQRILQKLRNLYSIDRDKAQNLYGISYFDLLRGIYDGDLEIMDAVFIGDMDEIRINLTQGNNRENFYKLVAKTVAYHKIANKQSMDSVLLIEMLSQMYPKLVNTALELTEENNELYDAIKKKIELERSVIKQKQALNYEDLKDDISDKEYSKDIPSDIYLTDKELRLIQDFDKQFIENIDINEFGTVLQRAVGMIKKYNKTQSVENISDKIASQIILSYKHNYIGDTDN